MFCDGTTICTVCHKRVPAMSGLCQLCGTPLEVRTQPACSTSVPPMPESKCIHLYTMGKWHIMQVVSDEPLELKAA